MNVYIKAKQISTNVRFQITIHRWEFSEFSKLKFPYDTVLVADFAAIPIICLLYYFFFPVTTIRTIPNTPIIPAYPTNGTLTPSLNLPIHFSTNGEHAAPRLQPTSTIDVAVLIEDCGICSEIWWKE